ncbi:MAG: histidine phosphatase family protein [Magnetovibrionaceae bacterium]
MITTRWCWIRHAPVVGHKGRLYGQTDVACDCTDSATFRAVARLLPEAATLVTTPLTRTIRTAEAIEKAGARFADRLVEPDFMEQDFGQWTDLTWDEMKARDPALYERFWQDPEANAPPGGESFVDLISRTGEAIDQLNRSLNGGDIVAVAHAGTIRSALARALDLKPEQALTLVIDNVSLTRLDYLKPEDGPGQWRLKLMNWTEVPR